MKNQKGITLIALVITIIVLLILAGVSIAMLTGENGILTKSKSAEVATREGTIKEALSLASSTITANKLDPNYDKGSGTDLSKFGSVAVAEVIKNDNAASEAASADTTKNGKGEISYKYNGKTYYATFSWIYDTEGNKTSGTENGIIGIDLSSVSVTETKVTLGGE